MNRRHFKVILLLFGFLLFWPTIDLLSQSKTTEQAVKARNVTLKGKVALVEIFMGRGPGQIKLQTATGEKHLVRLGSIRYLLQKGFNLSVGNEVEVKGIESNVPESQAVVAIEVTNITTKKTLRLRDENLQPLWRGGRNAN
jgi:hypothetical protein